MSNGLMTVEVNNFDLDSRLHADCILVGDLALSRVLLMNDARWPWLILVPRVSGATEPFDLEALQQQQLTQENSIVSQALRSITNCEKINLAAIGNIVRQLHVHIVARSEGDANWPGPVWGYGEKQTYDAENAKQLIGKIKQETTAMGQLSWI